MTDQTTPGDTTMSNLEIAQASLKAWEDRDAAKMSSLISDTFVLTGPAPVPLNKDAFLTFMNVHNVAFSNWKFNPRDWRENGDTVTATIRITATHSGVYDVSRLGLPIPPVQPTGMTPKWADDAFTFTIKGGKIVTLVVIPGSTSGILHTLEQLGVTLPAQ
jgi:hypothetical protein